MPEPVQSMHIEIRFDDRFRTQVVDKGDANPLTAMTIKVGENYLLGSSTSAVGDYMTGNLIGQFEVVPGIVGNEKQVVEFFNGPMWLVFEPDDDESVRISGCHTIGGVRDPSRRISADTSAVVPKQTWVSELVRVTKEYVETIHDLNPSLNEYPDIKALREYIGEYGGVDDGAG